MADTFGRMWIHQKFSLTGIRGWAEKTPWRNPPTETHGEPLEISRIIENYIVLLCILPISYVHQILFRDEKKL